MGHSNGQTICFTYSSLFPTQVDLVCALDSLKTCALPKITLFLTIKHMKKSYAMRDTRIQQKKEYTYDQMKKMVSKSIIDPTKVICLLKRGIKVSKRKPNKFQFTHDVRLNFLQPFNLSHENCLYYIKQISAPHLYIKTDDQTYDEDATIFNEVIDLFKKHCRHFEMLNVEGTHYVHLNNPELIASQIGVFLTKFHIEENNNVSYLRPIVSKM